MIIIGGITTGETAAMIHIVIIIDTTADIPPTVAIIQRAMKPDALVIASVPIGTKANTTAIATTTPVEPYRIVVRSTVSVHREIVIKTVRRVIKTTDGRIHYPVVIAPLRSEAATVTADKIVKTRVLIIKSRQS